MRQMNKTGLSNARARYLIPLLGVAVAFGLAGCGGQSGLDQLTVDEAQTNAYQMLEENQPNVRVRDVRCIREDGRNRFSCVADLTDGSGDYTRLFSFRCDDQACLLRSD